MSDQTQEAATTATPRRRSGRRRQLTRRVRNSIIGLLGPLAVRSWTATLRIRWMGHVRNVEGRPTGATSGIFAFWHQDLITLNGAFRNSGIRPLISAHGDGEMIARIAQGLGMHPVRGSTNRDGVRALLELIRSVEGYVLIAITPDGPRGPRYHFHSGAVFLAARTGLPICPTSVSYSRYASLPTWDGFVLPCPLARAVIHVGAPIQVPRDLRKKDLEEQRQLVETRLREMTEEGERDFDRLWNLARPLRDVEPFDPAVAVLPEHREVSG